MKGLYIHIPFCKSKCGYCDFYSFCPSQDQTDAYLTAVCTCMESWSKKISGGFDTVYFGGGTPSFFGGKRIAKVLASAKECFEISDSSEITVECNPSSCDEALFDALSQCGVNRISLGVQSAKTEERKLLGRNSDCAQVKNAICLAKKAGIRNISLDLMLGIPEQTAESLAESLDFIISSDVTHVSAYMLKLEEGTPLYQNRSKLRFPDEDAVCDFYLQAVKRLEEAGFHQYEISNFAKPGFESRHNTNYWLDGEYLGIGPSAHSFLGGKRFFYKRDFSAFLSGCAVTPDGDGGDYEEYAMLRLRLSKGINADEYEKRFSRKIPVSAWEKARQFEKSGHMKVSENSMSLTAKGFLLSNYIIEEIIEQLRTTILI